MNPRLEELLERLTASGPKCNAVSCSEAHEIVDLVFEQGARIKELEDCIRQLVFNTHFQVAHSWVEENAKELLK